MAQSVVFSTAHAPGFTKRGAPMNTRWHWSWVLVAPHRLGFLAAAAVMATSSLWWAAVLVARSAGHAPDWAIAPAPAHALLMSMGFMPLFMAGFLFTAGPRWLGLPDGAISARELVVPVAAMVAGWIAVMAGFHLHALLAAAGMAVVAGGWTVLCAQFIRLLLASRVTDRSHPAMVAIACSVGAVAMWIAMVALLAANVTLLRTATQVALWGFVATVFTAVSHRMLPFFTHNFLPFLDAWQPMWLLWVMTGALWLSALLAVADLWWWPLPEAVRWAQVAIEAPMAALLLWLAVRWGLLQSLKNRLLAMLHGGFAWLGIAFALAALSHALQALTDGELSLGLAPMHALTMGYLGATLLAMATRVASGHGGRPLAADNLAWALYWILQSAVVLRVIAALWPAEATPLTVLAVLAWATATAGWALRYGSWFGRPRIDGRPG